MRELERNDSPDIPPCARLAIIGRGRLGQALGHALRAGGVAVEGPLGRGADGAGADAILLCVPDGEIAAAASLLQPGKLVGHCSGATDLHVLAPHEAFSLHPLMTVTGAGATFRGAGAAIAGSSPRALALARGLAERLELLPVELADGDRALYHAAASVASNYLIAVEASAEHLAGLAGVRRAMLGPLVRASVENWLDQGPERALTGPIARGDEATVIRQREAIAARAPESLGLFDALTLATRRLTRTEGAGVMRTVRTVAALREALMAERRAGRRIGLVPTMGALHDGHLALLRRAREESDVVVMSLFVNPTQFGEAADLDAYPRDEARDRALAAELGVDVLFAPTVEEVYPPGFATTVSVAEVSEPLEGAFRGRAHFDGVATVVCKLLNMVGPDVAYFGQKDAQQALVIQRLVADLNLPVRIAVCPTVREDDGLAMSSRNVRLSPAERERALALSRVLAAARGAVEAGASDARKIAERARAELDAAGVQTEYFEIADPRTLSPLERIDRPALALVAARVGTTRLIDNQLLPAGPAEERSDTGDLRCSARC